MHITEQKAQIAFLKVCCRLCELKYTVFAPIGEPKDSVDLIALKDGICYRLQVKHINNEVVKGQTNGKVRHRYTKDDFDYYGIYLSNIDQVIFPSVEFAWATIATKIREYGHSFYWWEDFKYFTNKDSVSKRKCGDFGVEPKDSWDIDTRNKRRKNLMLP